MNRKIAEEWVRRLRSGEIEQITSRLGDPDGSRCCLGVLGDMAVEAGAIPPPNVRRHRLLGCDTLTYDGEAYTGYPPPGVEQWAETDEPTLCGYALLNDQGLSFAQIADTIEEDFHLEIVDELALEIVH